MAAINTIVFDLGGVMVDWNPYYVFRTVFDNEEDIAAFFNNICTSDWNEEQDAGRSLKEGTELLVGQFPEYTAQIKAYYDRWEEMLGGPIQGSVEILKELKQQDDLKTYALTNWSAETFPIALGKYEFLHWFDGRVVSGEEKTRKPFLPIYRTLIERFNIDPSQALYLDDNIRNLHPAQELGFAVHHFTTPENFREELVRLKLLAH